MDRLNIDWERFIDVIKYDAANPLLFNTGLFLVLFAGFIIIYSLIRRWKNAKLIFVILFSLYFYYKSSAEYCLILLAVCVMDFVLGVLMGRAKRNWVRRLIVTVNVLMNVGMLVYFKYFRLFMETLFDLTQLKWDFDDIILPAGISFFTFRSISYIVDLYRRKMEPCHNLLEYTFYLTFFPPLLAGPVVRAKDMLPQVKANEPATRAMISEGLFLIVAGLIKKVIVADYISENFVSRVFDNPSLYSGFENLMAVYGFLIQLYCDFSGYSDIAIGIALLLGYRFLDNFRAPFKSQNPTEFWHRWHISLSTWLRDYLYIPLGGNRKGTARKHFNLMTTMVIGGLWHGASWMYMIWGALQGIFLVIHKEIKRLFPALSEDKKGQWWRVGANMFFTFNLIAISFVFFRSRSLDDAAAMGKQIVSDFHLSVAPQFVEGYLFIVLAILLGYFMHLAPGSWSTAVKRLLDRTPLVLLAVILALVIILIIQVRQSDIVPFIYLQY
ncbi:MAG: MBOAT family protein [Candidatus Amulumruptor caecigallinarius]|nr:MBOAT family protein [Candidatus Amulumruptor caecigallinarius]MCM1397621.1 MBOAT family protein [Candidatus Amulumruptor caecigallinarius]MCM1454596.1 MBOAT family protein [bacterium]